MLGDMRVFDLGDELLIDCERVALQELFNLITGASSSGATSSCTSGRCEMALLCVIGPDAPQWPGSTEHDNARVEVGGATVDRGHDGRRHGPVLRGRGPRRGARGAGRSRTATRRPRRSCAWSGPPALRRRPRRERDPAGGRAQRARGLVHQGLLRGPGDGRAAATTAASRTGACWACSWSEPAPPGTELRLGEKVVGQARLGRRLARARADRARAGPARGERRATRCGRRRYGGLIVEVPFAR